MSAQTDRLAERRRRRFDQLVVGHAYGKKIHAREVLAIDEAGENLCWIRTMCWCVPKLCHGHVLAAVADYGPDALDAVAEYLPSTEGDASMSVFVPRPDSTVRQAMIQMIAAKVGDSLDTKKQYTTIEVMKAYDLWPDGEASWDYLAGCTRQALRSLSWMWHEGVWVYDDGIPF